MWIRWRKIWFAVIGVFGLLILGTIGLAVTAHLSLGEAFYRTTLIVTTRDVHYEFTTVSSRIVVIALILASFAVIAYLLKWGAEYMIGLGDNMRKFTVKARVDRMKDHYIICGLGRVGSQVVKELHSEGVQFVAIDRDKERVQEAIAAGYMAFQLDSTEEGSLNECGISHAKGLIAALGEDSSNLLVTLTAKSLNPDILVVARANRQENEIKLKRAGADRVVLPYQIGGYHMASMVLRPAVVDYLDVDQKQGMAGLEVEEMVVGESSKLAGQRLGKELVTGRMGATVIAINGADGSSHIRPNGTELIYAGDRLLILGAKQDLTAAGNLIR